MEIKGTPISSVMVKRLVTAKETDSIDYISNVFSESKVSHLPILDKENILKGLLSKQDYLSYLKFLSTESSGSTWAKKHTTSFTAKDLMSPSPMVLSPENTLQEAIEFFVKTKFHCIPIVEKKELVGILSQFDIIKHIA